MFGSSVFSGLEGCFFCTENFRSLHRVYGPKKGLPGLFLGFWNRFCKAIKD